MKSLDADTRRRAIAVAGKLNPPLKLRPRPTLPTTALLRAARELLRMKPAI